MGLSELVIALVSLIVGVIASIWVSRHYFNRSVDKALTPYVQYFSSLFDGVDPSVRESLKVAYKGTAVDELLDVQFLVANTGERAIKEVLAPLTLKMPPGCTLLDASILHVSPEGRDVSVEHSDSQAQFKFPLLNSDEFFITKLLIKGAAKLGEFRFSITVDDLPPLLKCERLPPEAIQDDQPREFDKFPLILGVVLLLLGTAVATLVYLEWPSFQQLWQAGLMRTSTELLIAVGSALVSSLVAILLLVLGVMLCAASFGNFSFPRRRRFQVPSRLHRARMRLIEAPSLVVDVSEA